jgi:hypothetical protein
MKTLKTFCQNFLVKIFAAFILLTITCCERYPRDIDSVVSEGESIQWTELLQQLDLESNIIIVQKDASIQDAIDAAEPGDAIYIEPGFYQEAININKPDIRLIGLGSTADGLVILENPGSGESNINLTGNRVEIVNIQLRNFIQNDVVIYPLDCAGQSKVGCRHSVERYELGKGIAHYVMEVPLGGGEFDLVRIHRVVRESRPYCPVRTRGDVFMIHGAATDYDAIFLTAGAEAINAETSSPYYLAANNIDVWGIDLAWTMVPMETTDFTFMKDWGIERDVDHVLVAMTIARLVRGLTRQGFCCMNLLGFSYGVHVAYGAANRETGLHSICRNVKGLIPVDNTLKYAPEDEALRLTNCARAADHKAAIDAGIYHSDWGTGFVAMGNLAHTTPDDPSPIPPFDALGFTNGQALMFVASNPENPAINYYWHFFGGTPYEWYYTDPLRFFRMAKNVPPYMPRQVFYEYRACFCDEEDVSFDDHIAEISVPVLYLGAGGGEGTRGDYTSNLTASADITNYTVSIPGKDPASDFGHADLWFGYDADELVWDVLRQWLVVHAGRNH